MPDDSASATLAAIRARSEVASKIEVTWKAQAQRARASAADVPPLLAAVEAALELADEWEAKSAEIWAQIQIQDCDSALAGFKAIGATRYGEDAKALRAAIRAALTGTGKELHERCRCSCGCPAEGQRDDDGSPGWCDGCRMGIHQ